MYPKNDTQYEQTTIAKVTTEGDSGWSIERADGWCFFVPAGSPVKPKVGMTARFYGDGIGRPVRGLFLAGKQVFYRTAEEEKKHQAVESYGADARDWLSRWDAGRSVWSIEMGGLGPGYEQAIQITVAEILRHLLAKQYDSAKWEDRAAWETDRKAIEEYGFANERINALGLSGAQWGAALNLAGQLYRRGPQEVMADERVKDRHIQVSRVFPVAA